MDEEHECELECLGIDYNWDQMCETAPDQKDHIRASHYITFVLLHMMVNILDSIKKSLMVLGGYLIHVSEIQTEKDKLKELEKSLRIFDGE